MGLLGPDGLPISSKNFQNKKVAPPALGERYGSWAGEDVELFRLPGGGAIAFDLNALTLADYRQMKDHYQINSSLSVLTFMMHQMEWHIESEDKKSAERIEENLRDVWSRLVRAKSQALWAGYSPNVLQWENDVQGRRIVLNKIKDLIPEDCAVKWDEIRSPIGNGAYQTFKVYGGIQQFGQARPIPVENSYWYPLLMENGNYYGKKLLRSAFQPWFFSTLLHLFANRYYERFGEPVPVGRAPYEDEVDVNGKTVRGNVLMGSILQQLRNRSAVVLPNEKTQHGDENTLDWDYQIEYLESQMRGADFERYMTRLDEEMSLALFTPILMMRTADVGSYNLGTQHNITYKLLLNAISGDWAHYINKYIVRPLNYFNHPRGENAPPARIKFVRMGKMEDQLLQAIVTELMRTGKAKPDVREIGEMAGMTLEEINEVTGTEETEPPTPDEEGGDPPQRTGTGDGEAARDTARMIVTRVEKQTAKAFREGTFGNNFSPEMGYRRQFEEALKEDGFNEAHARAESFYNAVNAWLATAVNLGADEFGDSDRFIRIFNSVIESTLGQVTMEANR